MSLRRLGLLVLLLPVLVLPATAAETAADDHSLDDLFSNLEAGLPPAPAPAAVTPDAGQRPMFLYFGSIDTQGIGITGYIDEARTNTANSIYYYLHFQGGIDVMPIPEARLIGTFSTYLPQDIDSTIISTINAKNIAGAQTTTATASNTGSVLNLDELYLDYAVLKSAMFRIGKYSVTWGQGRLFNPGNLVSDSSGAVNLRAFVPAGPFTFTGLIIGNKGFFEAPTKPKAYEFGYAAATEFRLGPLTGGLSGYHQPVAGTTGDFMLRTGFWDFDFYGEALAHHYDGSDWAPSLLFGTDREFDFGLRVQAAAEYWMEGLRSKAPRRHVALAMTTSRISALADLRLSAKWSHSITDGSGQLVVGLTAEPLPKVNVALGVPWTYGAADGYYVTNNSDLEKRRLSAALSVTVALDFEKDR